MAKKHKKNVKKSPVRLVKKSAHKKSTKKAKVLKHKPTPKHHKLHKSPERMQAIKRLVTSRSKQALRSCSVCGYRMLHLHEKCPMCRKCSVCKKPLSACVCYEGQ